MEQPVIKNPIQLNDSGTFSTPVLLCVFNRPDLTKKAIDRLRAVKPQKIYVSADGPRTGVPADLNNCMLVREAVHSIDWECDLKVRFLDENMGCGRGIASAIDWFFENETEGIILEDDTLPVPDFFPFCSSMLEKYRDESQINMVSGTNFFPHLTQDVNHFFTQLPAAWGWATWRRAWESYDFDINWWQDTNCRENILSHVESRIMRSYMTHCLNDVVSTKVDTWDYQWQFLGLKQKAIGVTSGVNLVTNVGVQGTHSLKRSKSHFLPTANSVLVSGCPESVGPFALHEKYDRRFLMKRVLPVVLKRELRNKLNCFIARPKFLKRVI